MPQFRLLGLSGSLRRASNSTAVLRGLQDALGSRAALDIFPLHAIPLYNEVSSETLRGREKQSKS
jgi:chromate reductase